MLRRWRTRRSTLTPGPALVIPCSAGNRSGKRPCPALLSPTVRQSWPDRCAVDGSDKPLLHLPSFGYLRQGATRFRLRDGHHVKLAAFRLRRAPSPVDRHCRQVRALRLLSSRLPDLCALGTGNGFAARAHLPDEARRRRSGRDQLHMGEPLR